MEMTHNESSIIYLPAIVILVIALGYISQNLQFCREIYYSEKNKITIVHLQLFLKFAHLKLRSTIIIRR